MLIILYDFDLYFVEGVHMHVEGVHMLVEGVHMLVEGVHMLVEGVHLVSRKLKCFVEQNT